MRVRGTSTGLTANQTKAPLLFWVTGRAIEGASTQYAVQSLVLKEVAFMLYSQQRFDFGPTSYC